MNIETRITEAAKTIFLKKGFKETSMSDIAAAVGLTRPALHYYFRTKERLFQAVFGDILKAFLPRIKDMIQSDLSLEEKLNGIIDSYLEVLMETPELPLFIMKEAHRDVNNLVLIATDNNIMELAGSVFEAIDNEMEAGRMKKIPLIEIVYTFYGLITFPFLSLPAARQICPEETLRAEFEGRWKDNVISQMLHLLEP